MLMMLSICSFGCDCDQHVRHRRLCVRAQISSQRKRFWPQRFSGHPRNSPRVYCDRGVARGRDGNGVPELPGFQGRFPDRLSAPYLPHDRKNRFPAGSLRSFTRPSNSCWIPSARVTDSQANRLSSRVSNNSRRRTRTAATHPPPDTARVARHSPSCRPFAIYKITNQVLSPSICGNQGCAYLEDFQSDATNPRRIDMAIQLRRDRQIGASVQSF